MSNDVFLQWIVDQSKTCEYVTSVCTGSALLAKAGMLDGVRATTNKKAFDWATSQGERVHWIKEARWVEDDWFFAVCVAFTPSTWQIAPVAFATGKTRSRAIPERLGFKLEGVFQEREYLYGRFVDQAIYSMLASEFQAKS